MKSAIVGTNEHAIFKSDSVPSVGVSSCLLGQKVRYDAGHKKNAFITEDLNKILELVPLCPEVAIGMGVPRQPIRLIKTEKGVRAQGARDPLLDVTDDLKGYARRIAPLVGTFSGYIFKKGSPSCGAYRVKVYNDKGIPCHTGEGVFTETVTRHYPNLPIEEEGRMNNPQLRGSFIKRIFIYHDWQSRIDKGLTIQLFQEFHRIHKFTLLAHDQKHYRDLGKMVAGCNQADLKAVSDDYIEKFMAALKNTPTPHQHINVLMRIIGFLKRQINPRDKVELLRAMQHYRDGKVSCEVPLTLIGHHLNNNPNAYLSTQHYLNHAMPLR